MTKVIPLCAPGVIPGATPDDWFGKTTGQTKYARERALSICSECPLKEPCAEYADREGIPHGIFGGITAEERIAAWGAAGPPKDHLAGLYAELDALTGVNRHNLDREDVA